MKRLPTKTFGPVNRQSKRKIDTSKIDGYRQNGSCPLFEYHCNESHTSSDAPIWYRSHQRVTILKCINLSDAEEMPKQIDRFANGLQLMYRVRFEDGLQWDVFEDELLDLASEFERPKPPAGPPEGEHGYIIMEEKPEGWRYYSETLARNERHALAIVLRKRADLSEDSPLKLRADLIDCKFKTPAGPVKGTKLCRQSQSSQDVAPRPDGRSGRADGQLPTSQSKDRSRHLRYRPNPQALEAATMLGLRGLCQQ
jgi:hypothetical protein